MPRKSTSVSAASKQSVVANKQPVHEARPGKPRKIVTNLQQSKTTKSEQAVKQKDPSPSTIAESNGPELAPTLQLEPKDLETQTQVRKDNAKDIEPTLVHRGKPRKTVKSLQQSKTTKSKQAVKQKDQPPAAIAESNGPELEPTLQLEPTLDLGTQSQERTDHAKDIEPTLLHRGKPRQNVKSVQQSKTTKSKQALEEHDQPPAAVAESNGPEPEPTLQLEPTLDLGTQSQVRTDHAKDIEPTLQLEPTELIDNVETGSRVDEPPWQTQDMGILQSVPPTQLMPPPSQELLEDVGDERPQSLEGWLKLGSEVRRRNQGREPANEVAGVRKEQRSKHHNRTPAVATRPGQKDDHDSKNSLDVKTAKGRSKQPRSAVVGPGFEVPESVTKQILERSTKKVRIHHSADSVTPVPTCTLEIEPTQHLSPERIEITKKNDAEQGDVQSDARSNEVIEHSAVRHGHKSKDDHDRTESSRSVVVRPGLEVPDSVTKQILERSTEKVRIHHSSDPVTPVPTRTLEIEPTQRLSPERIATTKKYHREQGVVQSDAQSNKGIEHSMKKRRTQQEIDAATPVPTRQRELEPTQHLSPEDFPRTQPLTPTQDLMSLQQSPQMHRKDVQVAPPGLFGNSTALSWNPLSGSTGALPVKRSFTDMVRLGMRNRGHKFEEMTPPPAICHERTALSHESPQDDHRPELEDASKTINDIGQDERHAQDLPCDVADRQDDSSKIQDNAPPLHPEASDKKDDAGMWALAKAIIAQSKGKLGSIGQHLKELPLDDAARRKLPPGADIGGSHEAICDSSEIQDVLAPHPEASETNQDGIGSHVIGDVSAKLKDGSTPHPEACENSKHESNQAADGHSGTHGHLADTTAKATPNGAATSAECSRGIQQTLASEQQPAISVHDIAAKLAGMLQPGVLEFPSPSSAQLPPAVSAALGPSNQKDPLRSIIEDLAAQGLQRVVAAEELARQLAERQRTVTGVYRALMALTNLTPP